jgi:hypothetical protein
MKANIVFTAVLLLLIGCTPQQSDQLTMQQKDQIKHEVKVVCDSIWANVVRLEAEATMQYIVDSPEFVSYNPDGSRSDFQAYKKAWLDFVSSAPSIKLTPAREDFYVLAKDAVVYAWFGKSEISLKSGDKMTYDPDAETFVFNKVGDKWKIVYSHESATIVTQKAGKK